MAVKSDNAQAKFSCRISNITEAMLKNDPIYHFVNDIQFDQVMKDIIQTPEFIRLHGIKQAGITGLFTKRSYDRAEHSVGVYILLKHLGANIEQCIGGLLHDIYHTNFSHTTDELFCGETQESFHEKNKFIFFDKCCSNITGILKRYFPTRDALYFLEGENLLVTKDKSFGADMVDYFMRDGYYEGILSNDWINVIVDNLKIVDGKMTLSNIDIAREFFDKTLCINETVYMAPFSRGQYKIFMHVLRLAISTKILTRDVLIYGYDSDMDVYEFIKMHGCEKIKNLIELLETTTEYSYDECCDKNWKKINATISRKLRFLDPLCESQNNCSSNNTTKHPQIISKLDVNVNNIVSSTKKQYDTKKELFIKTNMILPSEL